MWRYELLPNYDSVHVKTAHVKTEHVQNSTCQSSMGWLRLVGSLKSWVSFAKETYKRDCILQKRPIILRSLQIVATSYVSKQYMSKREQKETYKRDCILQKRPMILRSLQIVSTSYVSKKYTSKIEHVKAVHVKAIHVKVVHVKSVHVA